jgi:8-oxo-dGTP pyrophosphatase MutT (NUDIX family)
MEKQFTASAYIIEDQKVLLIFHRKLQKWLPPGGHMDANETPPEAAKREALEETGIEVELIHQENVWIDRWNAKSFERPYLCLLEEIPSFGNSPAHQHIDFIYVGRPVGGQIIQNDHETSGIRWFSWEEIEALKPDEEIFTETQQVIRHLLGLEVGVS